MYALPWFRQLQRRWFPHRVIRRAPVRRWVRPWLEALEGRVLPAIGTPTWVEQGPSFTGNPSPGVTSSKTSQLQQNVGAIQAVAVNPFNTAQVWVATVDGGIWRTANATAASPNWSTTVTFSEPGILGFTQATGTANISGMVGGVTIAPGAGGSGYNALTPPNVTFSAPDVSGGTQATGTAIVNNGQVTGVTITNPGSGYTATPTVIIDAPGAGGTTAIGTVSLTVGVTGVTITNPGSGYDSTASVTFSAPTDPTGTTAKGTVVVNNGQVTGVTIANGNQGSGYTMPTDQLPFLGMGDIALSPLDSNNNPITAQTPLNQLVLYAGNARDSANFRQPSAPAGLYQSTNGGATWTLISGTTFQNASIQSVVPTSIVDPVSKKQVVLVATDQGLATGNDPTPTNPLGLYRSADGGKTWQRITNCLPAGGVRQVIADPGNPNRFYAAISGAGVYRSIDGGVSWTPTANSQLTSGNTTVGLTQRIELAVSAAPNNNVVYAGLIDLNGSMAGIFRSTDQGDTWKLMDMPQDSTGGIVTDQGNQNLSLAADPNNANVLFVGGQSQPSWSTTNSWSGRHLRGVFDPTTNKTTWTSLDGKAPLNAVHADSRNMVFDADGNILEVNDGGIYRLNYPNGAAPTWSSVNGDPNAGGLRVVEFNSIAYDSVNGIVFGGSQDNGSPQQNSTGNFTWTDLSTGDGTITQVDNTSLSGQSIHYSTAQNLGSFYRRTYDNQNQLVPDSTVLVGLNVTNGQVKSVTIKKGGSGYTPNSQIRVSITGGGGSGATAVADVGNDGTVKNVVVTNGGSGYTTPPTVTFSIPNGPEVGTQATGTAVLGGTPLRQLATPPFTTPYVLNAVDPKRMLLGTTTLYESFDQGDTLNALPVPVPGMSNWGTISALAYGGSQPGPGGTTVNNPDVAYVGTGGPFDTQGKLYIRTGPGGGFALESNYKGGTPTSIAIDPKDWQVAYVVDNQGKVWRTTNGASFQDITSNLTTLLSSLNESPMQYGSVTVFSKSSGFADDVVFVGGPGGVYATDNPNPNGQWVRFDAPQLANRTLPNVLVRSVSYNQTTNMLVAGTFGRGAWIVKDASNFVGRQAPQVDNVPANDTFNQGGDADTLAPGLTVADAASNTLNSAQVTITNVPDGASEVLAADTTGTNITAAYAIEGATGVLTLTGTDTLADYQQVLQTVTYNDTAAIPNPDERTITFVVNDGVVNSDSAVTLETINDKPGPALNLNGSGPDRDTTAVFDQTQGPVVLAPAAVITDPNSSTLSSAQVTITNPIDVGSEVLTADTTGTGITASYNPSTGVLTLSGPGTLADYQQVLRTVTYSDNRPGTPAVERDVTVAVSDGSSSSAAQLVAVEVLLVNNAPVLDATGKFQLPALDLNDLNNQGSQVFDLLASAGPGTITDADPNAPGGMAVVGVDDRNGAWQWSDDDGQTWQNFVNPSVTNATLLPDDFGTRVRFVPVAGFSGTVALQVRAWDQNLAAPGSVDPETTGLSADTSTSGGFTGFSNAIGTVAVTVSAPVPPPPTPTPPASPSAAASVQFTSIALTPNLFALNETETINVHVSQGGGSVAFAVSGQNVSASVDANGNATVTLTVPLLSVISPQSITGNYDGVGATGSAVTTARWFLFNAFLSAIDTFLADGTQIVTFYFGGSPLLFIVWSPSGQITGFGLGTA